MSDSRTGTPNSMDPWSYRVHGSNLNDGRWGALGVVVGAPDGVLLLLALVMVVLQVLMLLL